MNSGKKFEQMFKASVPEYALVLRLPDAAQSFGGSSNLRFSRKSPFDYIMWDSKRKILYGLELKTVAGSSISFETQKDETKEIHLHQIKALNDWGNFDGVVAGFVIEFRKYERTVFIEIEEFNRLIKVVGKKSFNLFDLLEHDIKFTYIWQHKKKVNFTYDIDSFLNIVHKKQNYKRGITNDE